MLRAPASLSARCLAAQAASSCCSWSLILACTLRHPQGMGVHAAVRATPPKPAGRSARQGTPPPPLNPQHGNTADASALRARLQLLLVGACWSLSGLPSCNRPEDALQGHHCQRHDAPQGVHRGQGRDAALRPLGPQLRVPVQPAASRAPLPAAGGSHDRGSMALQRGQAGRRVRIW